MRTRFRQCRSAHAPMVEGESESNETECGASKSTSEEAIESVTEKRRHNERSLRACSPGGASGSGKRCRRTGHSESAIRQKAKEAAYVALLRNSCPALSGVQPVDHFPWPDCPHFFEDACVALDEDFHTQVSSRRLQKDCGEEVAGPGYELSYDLNQYHQAVDPRSAGHELQPEHLFPVPLVSNSPRPAGMASTEHHCVKMANEVLMKREAALGVSPPLATPDDAPHTYMELHDGGENASGTYISLDPGKLTGDVDTSGKRSCPPDSPSASFKRKTRRSPRFLVAFLLVGVATVITLACIALQLQNLAPADAGEKGSSAKGKLV